MRSTSSSTSGSSSTSFSTSLFQLVSVQNLGFAHGRFCSVCCLYPWARSLATAACCTGTATCPQMPAPHACHVQVGDQAPSLHSVSARCEGRMRGEDSHKHDGCRCRASAGQVVHFVDDPVRRLCVVTGHWHASCIGTCKHTYTGCQHLNCMLTLAQTCVVCSSMKSAPHFKIKRLQLGRP